MKYFILLLLILCCASHANEPLKNETYQSPTLMTAFQMETVIDANTQKEYCAYSANKRAAYERFQENIVKVEPLTRKRFDYNKESEFKRKKEMEDKLLYEAKDYPEQEAAFKLAAIYAGLPCETLQFDRALKYFSLSGRKPEAQFGTGVILYKQGKELKRAYDLFVIANERGVAKASYNMAVMLQKNMLQEKASIKYRKEIKSYLEKAGDGGYKRAYSDLSIMLIEDIKNNITDTQDIKNKALSFLNKSADGKDMYGLYNRAALHFFQGCTKQNAVSIVNDLYDSAIQRFLPALKTLKFLETQKCTMALSKARLEKLRHYNAHYNTYIDPSFDPFNKLLYEKTSS